MSFFSAVLLFLLKSKQSFCVKTRKLKMFEIVYVNATASVCNVCVYNIYVDIYFFLSFVFVFLVFCSLSILCLYNFALNWNKLTTENRTEKSLFLFYTKELCVSLFPYCKVTSSIAWCVHVKISHFDLKHISRFFPLATRVSFTWIVLCRIRVCMRERVCAQMYEIWLCVDVWGTVLYYAGVCVILHVYALNRMFSRFGVYGRNVPSPYTRTHEHTHTKGQSETLTSTHTQTRIHKQSLIHKEESERVHV